MHMQDNYLNLEIKRTLSNIENFVNKLESNEYYSDNYKIYLGIHKEFINCLIKNLDKIPTFLYQELLKHLNYEFIPILRYIQRSQTKDIPWSLIPNIERIINDLLGNNFIILLRPQWHWNYSVIVQDRSSYLKNIVLFFTKNKNLLEIKEKTHVISFPVLEKTNFLSHTIFGHEIGHFFQEIYFANYLTKNWRKEQVNKLLELLKEEKETVRPNKIEEIMNIYQGMVREILPDIIGYFLLGPSMLFVLYYFSYWHDDTCEPNTENNYYPPLKYRIRILQKLLENDMKGSTKKEKLFLKFNEEIKSYLSDKSDLSLINSHNLFKNAFDMFENEENKSNIINFCKKILKNGYSLFSVCDILEWKDFIKSLKEKRDTDPDKKQIRDFLDEESKEFIENWEHGKTLNEESKESIIKGLNDILKRKDFYKAEAFENIELSREAKELYDKGLDNLCDNQVQRFNRILFESIYPHEITKSLKNRIYNFNAKKIEKLIKDRIKKTIPPNEYKMKPVELGDIFLSGWIYYYNLLREKDIFSKDKYIKQHIKLDRLLLKASNLIYIHSYYLDHKKCLH